MEERSLCMREVPGSMPGSSIGTKLRHKFKASNKTTKITFNLDSQSTLCNGFLFYCNVLFIYYIFTKMLFTDSNLNQRPKDTCQCCNYTLLVLFLFLNLDMDNV